MELENENGTVTNGNSSTEAVMGEPVSSLPLDVSKLLDLYHNYLHSLHICVHIYVEKGRDYYLHS